MLRIKHILASVLFFLLVGMNTNVRASVDTKELIEESTQKGQSENESQNESEEQITHLDFFGAFSLVNVQLQWRDYYAELDDEVSDSESSDNQKELYLEKVESLSSNDEDQAVSASPIIGSAIAVIPVSTFRTIDGVAHFTCLQNKQSANTIAYILNCGTYPKSC